MMSEVGHVGGGDREALGTKSYSTEGNVCTITVHECVGDWKEAEMEGSANLALSAAGSPAST